MTKTFNEVKVAYIGCSRIWLSAVVVVAVCLAGTGAVAEGPGPKISKALQQSVAILGDSGLGETEKVEGLRAAVLPLFDFAEMARRSLGSHWRRRTSQQRDEFTVLFTRMLERPYANRLAAYNGERTRVVGEEIDGRYARVNTIILGRNGRKFKVDYRMHRRMHPLVWRIYDVVIEDISLVNNYRAQFNRVINGISFENLLERLRKQAG